MLSLTQAAALAPPNPSLFASIFLPGNGQLVVVAGCGRDLTWPSELIATHLLRATRGRLVQALLHGAARGADQAIAAAADQLGWPQIACPAAWSTHGFFTPQTPRHRHAHHIHSHQLHRSRRLANTARLVSVAAR